MPRDDMPINFVCSKKQVKKSVYGNTFFYLMTYGKPWFGLRIFLVCGGDVLKKKWQINILGSQMVLNYSLQPTGIITRTLILMVCCEFVVVVVLFIYLFVCFFLFPCLNYRISNLWWSMCDNGDQDRLIPTGHHEHLKLNIFTESLS